MNKSFILKHILVLILILIALDFNAQCTFTNPIKSGDSPDPHVIYKDGYYYGCHTTGGDVRIYKSATLQDIFNSESKSVWGGKPDIWAPEIHYLEGKWYIYTTYNTGDFWFNTIILESNTQDPFDGFTLKAQLDELSNTIDASVWQDPVNGQIYMPYSKMDGTSGMQEIWITKMSNPYTPEGNPVRLSYPQFSWEKQPYGVNEGPAFLLYGDKLHIVYSASQCHYENYCLGLLTADVGSDYLLPSSWVKSNEPVFQKFPGNDAYAVGHHSCVQTPGGEWWLVYHGKYNHNKNGFAPRDARMQAFYFKDDYPVFGIPVTAGDPIVCPDSAGNLCERHLTYSNPVISSESPDPGVYYHIENGYYYVYNTHRKAFRSKDLVNWEGIADVMDTEGSADMTWAPEVFKRKEDGLLYMFYTQDTKLYIAKSTSPEGPFIYHSGPLFDNWSIDSHYFMDDDGKEYIYWNTGGCDETSGIWVGELNDDLSGVIDPQRCFGAKTHPESWITECVREAPFLLKHEGIYYLVYSGNGTGANYGLGYATADNPRGPWTIHPDNPIMHDGATGPGHCSFTWSPDSSYLLVFYHQGHEGKRRTSVDKAEFTENGDDPDQLKIYFTNKTLQTFPFCENFLPEACIEIQTPFKDLTIPGEIEAEDFDEGCPGDAYYDADLSNNGGQYRDTPVDIENCLDEGGGYNVGWLTTGEWLEYTVDVKRNARYEVEARVASATDNNQFHIEFDGISKTAAIVVNSTGGVQSWSSVTNLLALKDGKQTMKIFIDKSQGGFNINKLIFTEYLSTDISLDNNKNIRFYKDPINENLIIESSHNIEDIIFCDILGRVIFQSTEKFRGTKQLDISNLKTGLYILKASVNNRVYSHKFIL